MYVEQCFAHLLSISYCGFCYVHEVGTVCDIYGMNSENKKIISKKNLLKRKNKKKTCLLFNITNKGGNLVSSKLECGIFKMRWIHTIPIRLSKTFMTFL